MPTASASVSAARANAKYSVEKRAKNSGLRAHTEYCTVLCSVLYASMSDRVGIMGFSGPLSDWLNLFYGVVIRLTLCKFHNHTRISHRIT